MDSIRDDHRNDAVLHWCIDDCGALSVVRLGDVDVPAAGPVAR
jgi:hypothetical protein